MEREIGIEMNGGDIRMALSENNEDEVEVESSLYQ